MVIAPVMDPMLDVDKLSYEIFSILESKFLFGGIDASAIKNSSAAADDVLSLPATPVKKTTFAAGKVRILSIDGGARASDALLAAAALARLETSLRQRSGHSAARIADFFDVAAGSGFGGVLTAMLFTRGNDGAPLFSAEDALRFLANNNKKISSCNSKRKSFFSRRKNEGILRRIFGDATLRDTVGPMLIPCYDLETCAPFVFSRADAVEMDGYDFRIADVCTATCANSSVVDIASADGRTKIKAIGAAVAMANPTAVVITHVLNNKHEFPLASSTDDLLVLSLGAEAPAAPPSSMELLNIARENAAVTVDDAVAMAFAHSRTTNYLRVQGHKEVQNESRNKNKNILAAAEMMLAQRNVESVLFRGSKISQKSNKEKLDEFSEKLVEEAERRNMSRITVVAAKHLMTPRTSSATTASAATTMTSTPASMSTSP